jgi:hypothetical protein
MKKTQAKKFHAILCFKEKAPRENPTEAVPRVVRKI